MAVGLRLNFPENTLDDYDKVCEACVVAAQPTHDFEGAPSNY